MVKMAEEWNRRIISMLETQLPGQVFSKYSFKSRKNLSDFNKKLCKRLELNEIIAPFAAKRNEIREYLESGRHDVTSVEVIKCNVLEPRQAEQNGPTDNPPHASNACLEQPTPHITTCQSLPPLLAAFPPNHLAPLGLQPAVPSQRTTPQTKIAPLIHQRRTSTFSVGSTSTSDKTIADVLKMVTDFDQAKLKSKSDREAERLSGVSVRSVRRWRDELSDIGAIDRNMRYSQWLRERKKDK